MNEPPQNEEAETGVLGAVLVGSDGRRTFVALVAEHGLRAEHFYRERHRTIFTAMLSLADRSEPLDVLTVAAELQRSGHLEDVGGQEYVHRLPSSVPSVKSVGKYAAIVRESAWLREVVDVARELEDAARRSDRDAIAEAAGKLVEPAAHERAVTVERRQHELVEHVERGKVDTLPWPFRRMNDMTGGLWPGHLTVLIGHSTHGKSVLADQILETAAKHGARCCAYLTEMTTLERDLRFVARRADIPLKRLMQAKLQGGESRRFAQAVEELPYELVPAGTWTVADVGRDIRRRGLNVAVIDLLNAISGRETRDIDESIARLAGIANDTRCHVIGCHHLNRARLTGATYPPEPSQGDIRGSGSVFDLATNVLSIYRHERDDSGEPGETSTLRFLKVKNGIVGKTETLFNGNRMRFELPPEPGSVGMAS